MEKMQQQQNAASHSAPRIARQEQESSIAPTSPWSVVSLEILPDYRLRVQCMDGVSGVANLSRLIHSPEAGVFARLLDPVFFAQASILYGAVTWPGECPDLAPDAMHKELIVALAEGKDELVL